MPCCLSLLKEVRQVVHEYTVCKYMYLFVYAHISYVGMHACVFVYMIYVYAFFGQTDFPCTVATNFAQTRQAKRQLGTKTHYPRQNRHLKQSCFKCRWSCNKIAPLSLWTNSIYIYKRSLCGQRSTPRLPRCLMFNLWQSLPENTGSGCR